jgi:hypothetical protein
MGVDEVLAEPARHRHPMVAIDDVVLAPLQPLRADARHGQRVQLQGRQRPAGAHGAGDAAVAGRQGRAALEGEVGAQLPGAADAADDLVGRHAVQAGVGAGGQGAGGAQRVGEALDRRRAAPDDAVDGAQQWQHGGVPLPVALDSLLVGMSPPDQSRISS